MSGVAVEFGARSLSRCAIDTLILVEGVSGAGKTTFIQQLISRELDPDVEAMLPDRAHQLPWVDSAELDAWLEQQQTSSAPGTTCPGVIVHYDLLWPVYRGERDYSNDPLRATMHRAKSVQVVCIRPSDKRVIAQLSHRSCGSYHPTVLRLINLRNRASGGLSRWTGRAGRSLVALVPARIRASRVGLWGLGLTKRQARRIEMLATRWQPLPDRISALDLYQREGALAQLYRAWDCFLDGAAAAGVDMTILVLNPASIRGPKRSWIVERAKPLVPKVASPSMTGEGMAAMVPRVRSS